MSEVGEVADALVHLRSAETGEIAEAKAALGLELFDAIWNLCALANVAGIDLEEAAQTKVDINASRSWAGP